MCQSYEAYLSHQSSKHLQQPEQEFLRDLSFTLASKRTQFPWRAAIVASTIPSLHEGLATHTLPAPMRADSSRRLAFVFTGQGTQWATMGMGLIVYSVFRQGLEKADAYLKSLGCYWSLICRSDGIYCSRFYQLRSMC